MSINPDMLLQAESDFHSDLYPWIVCQQSLTQKLQKQAGEAHLDILHQGTRLTNWWEQKTLQLEGNSSVFSREIITWAKSKPCWYARTMIPYLTFHNHNALFKRLENESIGDLIFNNTSIRRQAFITYAIYEHCIEYHWLTQHLPIKEKILWSRLSEFSVCEQSSFYLYEILLPELLSVAS